jgi:hypothetical protein
MEEHEKSTTSANENARSPAIEGRSALARTLAVTFGLLQAIWLAWLGWVAWKVLTA